jgi:lipopolysaccharide/colanic/teichoic acid biosynthesis glycosyltransferase
MMRLDDDQLIVQGNPAAARGEAELMLGSERIHRMFDFVAAATDVILFAPIFLVTSIAIKLDSILCETGIDELPQLFNVLRGELSMIGPSPSPCPNPLLNKAKPGMIQWRRLL